MNNENLIRSRFSFAARIADATAGPLALRDRATETRSLQVNSARP
ncbi:MAG: hypothetical protein NVV68_09775 [Dokdonella sp.]|nr:hypothetical protein [Dokdonella sp.]